MKLCSILVCLWKKFDQAIDRSAAYGLCVILTAFFHNKLLNYFYDFSILSNAWWQEIISFALNVIAVVVIRSKWFEETDANRVLGKMFSTWPKKFAAVLASLGTCLIWSYVVSVQPVQVVMGRGQEESFVWSALFIISTIFSIRPYRDSDKSGRNGEV